MRPVMLLSSLAACGPAAPPAGPTWHADVRPIVERHCAGCHGEGGGQGGISLASYEEALPWLEAIGLAVEERRMPPWLADPDCNTYEDDLSLPAEDRQTLLDWVSAGGPEGDAAAAAPPEPPRAAATLDRVDLTLEMPAPYTPQSSPDDYRCFLFEWPSAESGWVTAFDVLPGETDVVHHVIAFLIDPADREAFQALDEADPGEGYPCYGGPGGDIETLLRTRWLGGWAPGTGAVRMPAGTGIELVPGSLVALQMHYNVAASGPVPDRSAMALTVETEPQGWASLEPWADPAWVLGVGMDIPAHSEGVEHVYTYELDEGESFSIHAAGLHQHTLGRSSRLELVHADGSTSCILDIPRYDFDWQRGYALAEPVRAVGGDTLRLSCVWDNPTDRDVAWGEGTGDEMCVGLTLVSDAAGP
jgi:hypothetical protein